MDATPMRSVSRFLTSIAYKRLLGYPMPRRTRLLDSILVDAPAFVHAAILSIYLSASVLGGSIFFEQVNDRVLPHRSVETMYILLTVLIVILIIVAFIQKIRSSLFECVSNRMYIDINKKIFEEYFHSGGKNSEEFFSIYNDMNSIREFINGRAFSALYDAIAIPIYLLLFFEMHVYLGIAALIMIGMFSGIAYFQAKTRYRYNLFVNLVLKENRVSSFEIFSKAAMVRAMGMKSSVGSKWSDLYLDNIKSLQLTEDKNVNMDILSKFLLSSFAGVILAIGLLLVLNGEMGPGNAIGCMLVGSKLFQPFAVITTDWPEFLRASDAYGRLETFLAAHDRERRPAEPPEPDPVRAGSRSRPGRERLIGCSRPLPQGGSRDTRSVMSAADAFDVPHL